MQYFGLKENDTGVAISYDEANGEFFIVLPCHPEYGVMPSDGYKTITCNLCGYKIDSAYVEEMLNNWAVSWNVVGVDGSRVKIIREWVSAWTGIPEDNLEVTVS